MVQTDEPEARVPIQFGDNLRITVAANQGGRRYMEDRCVVHTERADDGELLWTFVGVYDGHGGEHASEYVRRHLLMNITKNQKFESDSDEDILEAIRQGFLMTHEQMRDVHEEWPYTASGFPSTAGTTVSCVFIRRGKLYTGHVGDSAIYLGTVENGGLRSRPLTIDHKPESAHEQIRIARAGGETAVKSGVTRVVWKRPSRLNSFQPKRPDAPIILDSIPFLSVARSLGDLWSYNEATNMFIVSPEPDLGVHRLTGNDFCLVLASDGMTNVLTGDQAISIVFKEEELVEIHEEINRNHSRCVLRSALQKWRSLRADNITVATVIFDIDPLSYTENEMLMKVGKYVNASQVLTDRPEAMLKISKTDNILLTTQRTPILYNGSRDEHYPTQRVLYRGPGFRTHDEELQHERQRILKLNVGGASIAIAPKGSIDSKRGPAILPSAPSASSSSDLGLRCRREEDDLVDYDYDDDEDEDDEDDEDDEEEDDGPFDPSEEISLKFTEKTITVTHTSPHRPSRPHAPRPVFLDDSIVDEASNGDGVQSTSSESSSSLTPSRTSEGVRRLKAEAVRRLRTPRIVTEPSEGSRRITRSASKASVMSPLKTSADSGASTMTLLKTPSLRRESLIGLATSLTPDAMFGPQTPRRSSRLLNSASKLTMSRKRARTEDSEATTTSMMPMMTGVTPVVAGLSLKDHHHHQPSQLSHQLGLSIQPIPSSSETPRLHFQSIFGTHSMVFPSEATPPITRSAPSTPKKSNQLKATTTKMTSLSALDEKKQNQKRGIQKDDGVIRISEVMEEEEDVMREPPSKIRRFYGYVRKIFWGK